MWYAEKINRTDSKAVSKAAILSLLLLQVVPTMAANVADAQASIPEEGMSSAEILSYAAMVAGFFLLMFIAWFTTQGKSEDGQPIIRRPISRIMRRR